MPAYGFMTEFVPALLAGKKPHTIRAPRKDGRVPQVGELFRAYTRMRHPECSWLFDSTVKKVETIWISRISSGRIGVMVGNKKLTIPGITALAIADGFVGPMSFVEHFLGQFGTGFHGYLIHWDPEDAQATSHKCHLCGREMQWSAPRPRFLDMDKIKSKAEYETAKGALTRYDNVFTCPNVDEFCPAIANTGGFKAPPLPKL